MSRRLYLGKLSPDTRNEEITEAFQKFGKLVDVRVMTGFGFVEFESARDAEDAMADLNGKNIGGSNITVEPAREAKPRRNDYDAPERSYAPRRRPAGVRVTVDGLARETSWQDLKDFGREACNSVTFADIDRNAEGRGILEYASREDAEYAVKQLDGKELRGRAVYVELDERGGADNFRRDDYRDRDRYRDRAERYDRYDRDRDDRHHREERPRRDRSGSPPRRDERARSPRRERDYEDRSRRDRDDYHDKRRDGGRRDDRERYEERSGRASNGEAAWGGSR